MRLSRQCEIAIDLLIFCALNPDENTKIVEAAEFAETTKMFAHQVVVQLTRAKLLNATRGRHGGLQLTRNPRSIAVSEVIRVMESALTTKPSRTGSMALTQLTNEAQRATFSVFDAFTISDLIDQGDTVRNISVECRVSPTLQSLISR